jgi:hypothetical protein
MCRKRDAANRDCERDESEKNKTAIWTAIYSATWTTVSLADREDDELDGAREIRQERDGGREGRSSSGGRDGRGHADPPEP